MHRVVKLGLVLGWLVCLLLCGMGNGMWSTSIRSCLGGVV